MDLVTKPKSPEKIDADAGAAATAATVAAAAVKAELKPGKVSMGKGLLTITGPETGRRRAGHVFGKEPVDIDASTLTQAAVDMLLADPLLSVKQGR